MAWLDEPYLILIPRTQPGKACQTCRGEGGETKKPSAWPGFRHLTSCTAASQSTKLTLSSSLTFHFDVKLSQQVFQLALEHAHILRTGTKNTAVRSSAVGGPRGRNGGLGLGTSVYSL